MTPEERKMLTDLADRFSQTPAGQRDPEAEEIVRTKIGSRPDALYLMTQTVLIQNLALQRAQQQIQDLQRNVPAQSGGSSWLGQPANPGYGQSAPPPQYVPAQPQYAPPPQSSFGGGGFLRGAAQTAAGVAAGTLAAEAIGSMFNHQGGGFGGNEFVGGGAPTEVINNYYDSPTDSNLGPNSLVDERNDQFVDPAGTNISDSDDNDTQFDDSNFDAGDGGFDDSSDDNWT